MKSIGWVAILVFSAVILAGCGQQPQPKTVDRAVSTSAAQAQTLVPGGQEVKPTMAASPTLTPTPTGATSTPISQSAAPTATALAPSPTPSQAAPTPMPTQIDVTATPAAKSVQAKAPDPTADAGCVDKAAFYSDVTIPDGTSFKQNTEFVKTWQIKNEGNCTWDGYQLVFLGGYALGAPLANPLPLIRPGEITNISLTFKSPIAGGVYVSRWIFQNRGGIKFGVNANGVDDIWAKISVTYYPEGSTSPGVTALPDNPGCAPQLNPAYISQIITLINNARTSANLSPLVLQDQLSAAAQGHSVDLACHNELDDHVGSDGSDWFARIRVQNYAYSYASENVYRGNPEFGGDAAGAFDWWWKSKTHHDNIMSPKVTEIGIGYAYNPTSSLKGYYTLDFGRR